MGGGGQGGGGSPRGQRGLDSRGHLCDWRREGTGPGDVCWGAGQGAFWRRKVKATNARLASGSQKKQQVREGPTGLTERIRDLGRAQEPQDADETPGAPSPLRSLCPGSPSPQRPLPPRLPLPSRVCLPTPSLSCLCFCGASAPRWPRPAPLLRRCTPTLSRPCPGLPCSQRWSLVEALPMPCPLKPSVPTPALTRSERLVWGGAGRTARRPMPGWPWPQGKLRGHLEPERPICCCPGFLLWPSPHGWARSRPSWALGTSRAGPLLTHRPLSPAPKRSLGSGELGATQTEPSTPQGPPCCRPCLGAGLPPPGP